MRLRRRHQAGPEAEPPARRSKTGVAAGKAGKAAKAERPARATGDAHHSGRTTVMMVVGDVEPPTIGRRVARGLRRVGRVLLFPLIATVVVTSVLAIGIIPARAYLEQRTAITGAQARLDKLSADNAAAAAELTRLQSDEEIEKVARQQYGLVKPGEEVYHILPAPQDPVTVPDAWPFDPMRKRLRAQAPPSTTTTTAPAGPAAPGAPTPSSPAAGR